jgi:hypothetical protein
MEKIKPTNNENHEVDEGNKRKNSNDMIYLQ